MEQIEDISSGALMVETGIVKPKQDKFGEVEV